MTTSTANRTPLLVDFALQGGGAHGAFTWGVLDRLLEEPWLRIDGISGTSAGAMNAAVLVDGYADNGADGARAALENFWRRVARTALLSPLRRTPLDVLLGRWTLDHSPVFVAMDLMARLFSPYDLSPGGANPLRDILAESVDFDRLAKASIKLFVAKAIGTAATRAIPPSRRWCGNAAPRIRFSFRSIRSNDRGCRALPATFSTGSTRSRSMPCC
jgi:NTE family protein